MRPLLNAGTVAILFDWFALNSTSFKNGRTAWSATWIWKIFPLRNNHEVETAAFSLLA